MSTLVIDVSGGVVQNVSTYGRGRPKDYCIIDWDVEGSDEERDDVVTVGGTLVSVSETENFDKLTRKDDAYKALANRQRKFARWAKKFGTSNDK